MKNLLMVSICLILCIGCKDEKASSNQGGIVSNSGDSTAKISSLEPSTYKTALDKSLASTPIDRLCKESKGYNQNEWEGKNACAWAVEKYRIEAQKDLVARKEGVLSLQLDNGALEIEHPMEEGAVTKFYYQFNEYIKPANAFCLLAQQIEKCPQYWIIDRKDGSKTILNGQPIFNAQQDAFVLSTASQQIDGCGNDIAYWKLKNGKFIKTWSQHTSQNITDLVWAKEKTWYGCAKSEGQKVVSAVQITPEA